MCGVGGSRLRPIRWEACCIHLPRERGILHALSQPETLSSSLRVQPRKPAALLLSE